MLIAYNNDIEFRSRWYHIQTEDNGIKDGHVTTTVFYSGQILDSRSTSYLDAIKGVTDVEAQNKIIKDVMTTQHKFFYTKLYEGTYESMVNNASGHRSGGHPGTGNPAVSHVSAETSGGASHASLQMNSSLGRAEMSGNASRLGKPDILRASQQLPGMNKALGIKSFSSVSPVSAKPSAVQKIGKAEPSSARKSALSKPLELSNAVMEARKRPVTTAWRGVTWSKDDLAIDVLAAKLLAGMDV